MLLFINSEEELQEGKFILSNLPTDKITIILNLGLEQNLLEPYESILGSIDLKIHIAQDGDVVRKKRIYVPPMGSEIRVCKNRIVLVPLTEAEHHPEFLKNQAQENPVVYQLKEKLFVSNSLLLKQKIENSRNKGLKALNEKLHTTNESLRFSWNLLKESNEKLITENKQLNGNYLSEISHSERIRGILNGIPAHLALLDTEGVIVEVNDAWKKFASLNNSLAENYHIGMNYLHVCESASGQSSENSFLIAEGIRSVIHGKGNHFSLEYPCHSPTEKRWFRLIVSPLRERAPREVVVMHLDISDKKLAEIDRLENINKYKNLVETSSNIIFSLNHTCEFTFVNKRVTDILGYHPSELIGNSFISMVNLVKSELEAGSFARMLSGENLINFEVWVTGKNNLEACLRINSKVILDEENRIVEILGTATDVTTKITAEESYKKSEAHLRAIFNSSIQSIILIDKDYKILSFNKVANNSCKIITGKELQEGQSFLEIVHPSQIPIFERRFIEVLSGKTLTTESKNLDQHSNSYVWMETIFNPVTVGNEIIGVCLSTVDITKRKTDEEKINEQYEELQKANSELDRFVYCASHDLKAPLTSVMGIINVAKIDNASLAPEYFGMIEKTVDKLMKVINDLTNFSRNARLDVEKEMVDMESLIQETIHSLSYLENASKIKFSIQVDGHKPYTDKTRMAVLLNNILSNCIIYHNYYQDEPLVSIACHCEKNKFTLIIKDNGIGIEEKHLEKVFNMFYRGSQKSSGSGLGLYIVKGIVEKLNGSIDLISKPAKGTKFIITFPNYVT